MRDPLSPARGILLGAALGFLLWYIAAGITYLVLR